MNSPTPDAKSIFGRAAEIPATADRAAYLDKACAGHPAVRLEVESLLNAIGNAGSFMAAPVVGLRAPQTIAHPSLSGMPDHRLESGAVLGDFKVVRFIDDGGMGEIYEAKQWNLGHRRVALKVIRQGRCSQEARTRFLREQEVLARLHQTNIVPVFAAGEKDGLQYFAMQYIEGATLGHVVETLRSRTTESAGSRKTSGLSQLVTKLVEAKSKPELQVSSEASAKGVPTRHLTAAIEAPLGEEYWRSVAHAMAEIAEALHSAHRAGYFHRDIKPSNLMLGSDGKPWLIDFGLAGLIGEAVAAESPGSDNTEPGPTRTGAVMGTPPYMSPEQVAGKAETRSDIWSLGVTLYELLTLTRPFTGRNSAEVFAKIPTESPIHPRKILPSIPVDLEAICLKCLEKEPDRRYADAEQLATDLRRWLAAKPTVVRPDWWTLRPLRLWARRQKAWAATAAALLVLLVGGLVFSAELADTRRKQLVELEKQQQRERVVSASQQFLLGQHSAGWSHEAMRLLKEGHTIRPGDDLRNSAVDSLAGVDAAQIYNSTFPHPRQLGHLGVGNVVFSPNGKRVLAAGWSEFTGKGFDHSPALLWDGNIANKPTESTRPGGGPIAFPDEDSPLQLILPYDVQKPLTLWNVGTNTKVVDFNLPMQGEIVAAALSADAQLVAASIVSKAKVKPAEPVIVLWAIDRKVAVPAVKKLGEWPGTANKLAFSPDGLFLATGSGTGDVMVRSAKDGKVILEFSEGELPINALAFGRNYHRSGGQKPAIAGPISNWTLGVGGKGGKLSVWDLSTKTRLNRYYGSEYEIFSVAFSPDGSTLASCGRNHPFIWDVGTGKPLLRVQNHKRGFPGWTNGVAFSPDGHHLAFGSASIYSDGGLDVFRLDSDRGTRLYRGLTGVTEKVWLSPSGRWVAALSQDWQLGVWDRATGSVAYIWDVPAGFTADNSAVAFDEDDTQILFASGERVSRWKLQSGERTGAWEVPRGLNDSLVTRPGKKPLLVRRDGVGDGRRIRARELEPEGKTTKLYELDLDADSIDGTFHSSDGRILLVNVLRDPIRKLLLFDGLTGKPMPFDPPEGLPQKTLGRLSPAGSAISVKDQFADSPRCHIYRLSDQKLLGTHAGDLARIDDAGKLGVFVGPFNLSESGVSLYRVREDHPIVTFDAGRPPTGNGYGISADGRFVYWGRRDGTVCVADVNKCLEQLAPFGK